MDVLVVNQHEVAELLPMPECIDVMQGVFEALARGEAILPLRSMVQLPNDAGIFALMPSYLASIESVGVKAITVFPGNEGTELDAHQGAVLLFDGVRGSLRGVFDATSITAIRTAAVSGVATRALAREDASSLAILGSGTQARTHLEAMLAVRPVRRVRVWSRTEANARRFVGEMSAKLNVPLEVSATAREAVEGADLVCTTTSSKEPVLHGEWLSPGAHVNAVGYAGPAGREVDAEAIRRSRLYADKRESLLNEAGDFLLARDEGVVDDSHLIGELGEVLVGAAPGRQTDEDITFFESLGLAVEDLAAAHHIYEKAKPRGLGTWLPFGGTRD